MGGKQPRSEMTEQQRLAVRRQAKHCDYLLRIGQPVRIPAEPAVEHFQELTGRGMSAPMLAAQSGLSVTTCRDLVRGRRPDKDGYPSPPLGKIDRDTVERALGVRFVEPAPEGHTMGMRQDGTGVSRRIQALMAGGWSLRVIGTLLDVSEQRTWQLAVGKDATVLTRTALKVVSVYGKYQHVDPLDYGLTPFAVTRAKGAASRRGYAPAWAWDDDTIDDPAARPEWTGECGTEEGYRIHVRETLFNNNPLPPCAACREAVETRPPCDALPMVFDYKAFDRILTERGLNCRQAAALVCGDNPGEALRLSDTMYRWRDGSRRPQTRAALRAVAVGLDVDLGCFLDEEATALEASKAVVGRGAFNPYVLRAALEMSGLTQRGAAELPGSPITQPSIANWLAGRSIPSSRDKLRAIAAHFGVSIDVFYS